MTGKYDQVEIGGPDEEEHDYVENWQLRSQGQVPHALEFTLLGREGDLLMFKGFLHGVDAHAFEFYLNVDCASASISVEEKY